MWYGWSTKGASEIFTIANVRHAASKVWTCAEPEFRLSWMKLCGIDNHYTTTPLLLMLLQFLVIAQKVYPRNPSNCTILDRWVFENFVLADEPFAKTLQIHETCVLANNNWCEKLISSLESPTSFDEIFKVTWVPFFSWL